MELTPEPVPVAPTRPAEKLQSQLRLDIKITKDPNTGEVKTYIINLDITNYDCIIKDVPYFLSQYNVRNGVNLIEAELIAAAQ